MISCLAVLWPGKNTVTWVGQLCHSSEKALTQELIHGELLHRGCGKGMWIGKLTLLWEGLGYKEVLALCPKQKGNRVSLKGSLCKL